MPTITDWLMVGITAIYVVATVFICYANFKSANETKKQTEETKREFEETKREFEETKRIDRMPFLQVDIKSLEQYVSSQESIMLLTTEERVGVQSAGMREIVITNVGNGVAVDIVFGSKSEFVSTKSFQKYSLSVHEQKGIPLSYLILKADTSYSMPKHIVFEFRDIFGNQYKQVLTITLAFEKDKFTGIADYSMQMPVLETRESN